MCIKSAPDRKSLAARLKSARISAGYTNTNEVSRALGWPTKRYYTYETGRASVPYANLYELAQLFHTSTDALLGMPEQPEDGKPPVPSPDAMVVYRALSSEASASEILAAIQLLQIKLAKKIYVRS